MESSTYPRTIFSPSLISRVGDIGKVLGEFLNEQKDIIQRALESKFPEIDHRAVQKVLNAFITLEGTKRPLRKNQIHISGINSGELEYCLDQLEKSRILRYEDGLYELAHDTLAKRISEERSVAEVAFLEVIKLVRDRQRMYSTTNTLLNANELQVLKSVESRLKSEDVLTPLEWNYIQKSRKELGRRRVYLWSIVSAIFLVLAIATIYSFQQRGIAIQKQAEAEEAQKVAEENLQKLAEEQAMRAEASYNQHLASGKTFMNQSEYVLAIQEFDMALTFKPDGEEAKSLRSECEQLSGVRDQFERLIREGDALMARGNDFLVDARNKYLSARRLGYQNVLADSKITTVEGKLPAAFDEFMRNGDTFKRVNDCGRALENYRKAQRIRPDNAELKRKIEECSD